MEEKQSSASILRISDEKTLLLIDLYRKEECLWNTMIYDYKNKVKRTEAAQKIADILNIPNFGPRHVIMKFKNLRNSYSQELKKIAKNRATGDGCYRPTVFWYEHMDRFIRPHLQPPRSGFSSFVYLLDGNEGWAEVTMPEEVLQTELTEVVTQSGSDSEPYDPKMRKRKSQYAPNSLLKRFKGDSESEDHNNTSNNDTENPNAKNGQACYSPEDQQNTIASALKDLAADVHLLMSQKEDYFDSFGKYVAGLLRSIPHRKALEIQPKIISLITSAGYDSDAQGESNYYCDGSSVEIKVEKL